MIARRLSVGNGIFLLAAIYASGLATVFFRSVYLQLALLVVASVLWRLDHL